MCGPFSTSLAAAAAFPRSTRATAGVTVAARSTATASYNDAVAERVAALPNVGGTPARKAGKIVGGALLKPPLAASVEASVIT
jgi:hypothetical protein